ncbi:MAG: glycosyltransferase family 2 protein [Rhodanobacteraceae bacterium]
MTASPNVSAIIPTYNRRELLGHALRSVLAQSRPVEEIIVVDDGSTDGTDEALRSEFGDRIVYVRQANAGVSAARNRGMSMARGRYIALLDSDDEWLPEKTARQVDWLDTHPDFGMVLCDVERIDATRKPIDLLGRRAIMPEDGWVLKYVLDNPALAPVSAMFRREVYADVGGFDVTLRTAEDLDFHLRIARRWQIGVVDEVLARAIRGHDGLSSLAQTYDDYTRVMERAAIDATGIVEQSDRDRALATTYLRNARGMLYENRWRDAFTWGRKAWRLSAAPGIRSEARTLGKLAVRRMIGSLRPRSKA